MKAKDSGKEALWGGFSRYIKGGIVLLRDTIDGKRKMGTLGKVPIHKQDAKSGRRIGFLRLGAYITLLAA
jgi:hypothetical protein